MISAQNRALLEAKFGRAMPAGDPKVTLTLSGICKLLDAARAQGRPSVKDRRSGNLDEIMRMADDIVHGRRV